MAAALRATRSYLYENRQAFFGLVVDYLREEQDVRSISDINHHFSRNYSIEGVDNVCEWLAEEGFLILASAPVRLTAKSRVNVEEAAYYVPEDAPPWP